MRYFLMNQFLFAIVENLVKDVFSFLVGGLNREAIFNKENNTLLYQLSKFLSIQTRHNFKSTPQKVFRFLKNTPNKYKSMVNTKSKRLSSH